MHKTQELSLIYKPEFTGLAQKTWSSSPTSKKNPTMPPWFDDVVSTRGFGMLNIMIFTDYPWIVFPEFVPNFSIIAFHRKKKNTKPVKLEELQMKYFEGVEGLDADKILQKAVSILCKRWITKHKGIMKLEDENMIIFMFPSEMLKKVLLALGLPKSQLNQYSWIKKEQVNWSASGFY